MAGNDGGGIVTAGDQKPKGGATGAPGGLSTGKGGSGKGGAAADPFAAAEARANAKERKAKNASSKRFLNQAATLQKQVDAIRRGIQGERGQLDLNLKKAGWAHETADASILDKYNSMVEDFAKTSADNEKAAADSTFANLNNRQRERASAVSEAMNLGAGESDLLRSQAMSLRNWNANQGEVNRAYFDTNRTINSGLTDLTSNTRQARTSEYQGYIGNKDQLWQGFYDTQAENYINLSNKYGEQADAYGYANEAIGSKKAKSGQTKARNSLSAAANTGADFSNSSWAGERVPGSITDWKGADPFEAETNLSRFSNATSIGTTKRPEGATLRSW